MNRKFTLDVICVSFSLQEGVNYINKLISIHGTKDIYYCLVFKREDIPLRSIKNAEHFKIIKQKNIGIYDAMNLGYASCFSTWAIFSNVGDTLVKLPDNLDSNYAINCFPVDVYSFDKKYLFVRQPNMGGRLMPPHQGMFFNRNLLPEMPYNTKFLYAGDFELFARFKHQSIFYHSPVVSEFYLGGVSNQTSTLFRRKLERFSIILRNIKNIFFVRNLSG